MFKKPFILMGIFIILSLCYTNYGYPQYQQTPRLTTIEGEIAEIFFPYALLRGSDGKEYEIFLGPPWFWVETDFSFKIGDKVKVKGEVEDYRGIRTLYPYSIIYDKEEIKLVDEDGIPLWRYGGYRGIAEGRGRNWTFPYSYQYGRGYYRQGWRDQLYGRGMGWRHGWAHRGCYGWWIGGKWDGRRYLDRRWGRGYYLNKWRYPYRRWNFKKEEER